MKRSHVFKPTNDDWYPCHPENTVKLCYIGKLSDGKYRVAAWGNDDYGLEQDFETEREAISIYERLGRYPFINQKDLLILKFRNV